MFPERRRESGDLTGPHANKFGAFTVSSLIDSGV